MKKIKTWVEIRKILLLLFLFVLTHPLLSHEKENWYILLSKSLLDDEAIKVVLKDLKETGLHYGLKFTIQNDNKKLSQNSILVGAPDRNVQTARLVKKGKIQLQGVNDPQGYEIITKKIDGKRVMIVSGGSIIGDVYGLYWIWDRIRVFKKLPEINVNRIPKLKTCISLSWGRRGSAGESKEAMQRALRYSINWVSGP